VIPPADPGADPPADPGAGSVELTTARLTLRGWRPEDRQPFAALNSDPVVMEHFPAPLTRGESDALADRIENDRQRRGWGLWAAEVRGGAPFIGFIGLNPTNFDAHFTPAVEVGWRLDRPYWGFGYATEGAAAALDYAFTTLGLEEIVSMTTPANERSWRVMQRLGMSRRAEDDFDHPRVPQDSPVRPHVLYRLARGDWAARRRADS
jgi:RimJ/RimL family protein N-acetyltransferase